MLSKRTNILFDEQLFTYLVALAQREGTSVGDLVRKAVTKTYIQNTFMEKKMKAYQTILRIKKNLKPVSKKEIKEFIEYGRT